MRNYSQKLNLICYNSNADAKWESITCSISTVYGHNQLVALHFFLRRVSFLGSNLQLDHYYLGYNEIVFYLKVSYLSKYRI